MASLSSKHTFEADIQKLLHLLIRSVYSNRDVFLRELVSNASDAIDKVRVLKIGANEDTKGEYGINVRVFDNVLEIYDNGVGMDDKDLHKNLSTIAHSGTNEFVQNLNDKTHDMSDFIGQFGVGFYSCFLVSSDVEVITRKWGCDDVWKWTSDGVSTYTVEKYDGSWEGEMEHGTFIRIKLKEDSEEYAKDSVLKRIIQQHSKFISYPIKLWVEKEREEERPKLDTVVEEEENENEGNVVVEEGGEDEIGDENKVEKVKVKYNEWEQVNGAKPLWYKEPSEITADEYKELFRSLKTTTDVGDEVLYWRHFKAEGKHEFQGIFYLSRKPTADRFNPHDMPEKNIRLYVKKVMIMENCGKELIPDWMCFVSGIVDSNDLALNVSREMLQNNQLVRSMKSYMTKQVIKMLGEFFEKDRKMYNFFYENNNRFLKWGITEREHKLVDFLMYSHSLTEDPQEMITFDEYVERFVDNQKQIFYITGDERTELVNSVFLERFRERNICVLFFTDPIDEFLVQHVRKFKEYDLVDIGKEFDTDIFDDLKDGKELEKVTMADLSKKMSESLTTPTKENEEEGGDGKTERTESEEGRGEKEEVSLTFMESLLKHLQGKNIQEVRQSLRLKDTPACLVSNKYGWTGHMERVMKAQPLQDKQFSMMSRMPKLWEVNLGHRMMKDLKEKYEKKEISEEDLTKRLDVLYEITAMQSGYPLKDGPKFCRDLFEMLENPL